MDFKLHGGTVTNSTWISRHVYNEELYAVETPLLRLTLVLAKQTGVYDSYILHLIYYYFIFITNEQYHFILGQINASGCSFSLENLLTLN